MHRTRLFIFDRGFGTQNMRDRATGRHGLQVDPTIREQPIGGNVAMDNLDLTNTSAHSAGSQRGTYAFVANESRAPPVFYPEIPALRTGEEKNAASDVIGPLTISPCPTLIDAKTKLVPNSRVYRHLWSALKFGPD
jgi:hypothetical protein